MLKGVLPWKVSGCRFTNEQTCKFKEEIPSWELFSGCPYEFRCFHDDVRNLQFEQDPYYETYIQYFSFLQSKYPHFDELDWVNKNPPVHFIHIESQELFN